MWMAVDSGWKNADDKIRMIISGRGEKSLSCFLTFGDTMLGLEINRLKHFFTPVMKKVK